MRYHAFSVFFTSRELYVLEIDDGILSLDAAVFVVLYIDKSQITRRVEDESPSVHLECHDDHDALAPLEISSEMLAMNVYNKFYVYQVL